MRKILFVFIFIGLFSLFVSSLVFADLPPPAYFSIEFRIFLGGKKIQDPTFYAVLLTCKKKPFKPSTKFSIPQLALNIYDSSANCYWQPEDLALTEEDFLIYPFIMKCHHGRCISKVIDPVVLPAYFRLAVYLPSQNKVFISSKRKSPINNSLYMRADLSSDGKIVLRETIRDKTSTLFMKFVGWIYKHLEDIIGGSIIFVFDLIIELFTAFLFLKSFTFFKKKKISYKILDSVVWANVISFPSSFFFFAGLDSFFFSFLSSMFSYRLADLINQIAILVWILLVFIFEALFVYYTNRSRVSLKGSFGLSFITNFSFLSLLACKIMLFF